MRQRLVTSELFLKAQTDERLAALAGEGHTRAFAVLVERHRRVLLAHARGIVGSERSEDVLQQALLKAWRSLDQGIEVQHAQAWLHRIVHNTALTEVAHQPRNLDPLDENLAELGSTASVAEQRFEVREVLQGLAGLPQHQRLALLGTELEGRSRRQLADELGLSEGAVRQLVHRARTRVRAGIAVLVPFPLIERLMRTSGWLRTSGTTGPIRPAAEVLGGTGVAAGGSGVLAGGSGVLAGGAAKLAAVVVAAGALGGGALLRVEGGGHRQAHAGRAHRHVLAGPATATSSGGSPSTSLALLAARNHPVHVAAPAARTAGTRASHRHHAPAPRAQAQTPPAGPSRPVDHSTSETNPPRSDSTTRTTKGERAPTKDGSQTNRSDSGATTTTDRSSPSTTPSDTPSTTTGTDSGGAVVSDQSGTSTQQDSTTAPATTTTQTDTTSTSTGTTTTDN